MKRDELFRRDGWTCVYCATVLEPEECTVDHIEPRVKGGDNSRGNLVTACGPCNTSKRGLVAWSWLERRPVERENFLRLAVHAWPRLRSAVVEAARDEGVATRDGSGSSHPGRGGRENDPP